LVFFSYETGLAIYAEKLMNKMRERSVGKMQIGGHIFDSFTEMKNALKNKTIMQGCGEYIGMVQFTLFKNKSNTTINFRWDPLLKYFIARRRSGTSTCLSYSFVRTQNVSFLSIYAELFFHLKNYFAQFITG
jgi:arginyl-tRNA synthetase